MPGQNDNYGEYMQNLMFSFSTQAISSNPSAGHDTFHSMNGSNIGSNINQNTWNSIYNDYRTY
mgnify:CR=1|jgi:hypothetical protein